MTKFEEIIYIADITSSDRNYEDVDIVRKLAYKDINECMLYILNNLIEKNSLICLDTIEAYNYYYLKIKNCNQEEN